MLTGSTVAATLPGTTNLDYLPFPTTDNEAVPTLDSDADIDKYVLDPHAFPSWDVHTATNCVP